MNKRSDIVIAEDPDDIGFNDSKNEEFSSILNKRVSRRGILRGGLASAAGAFLGSVGLSACGGNSGGDDVTAAPFNPAPTVPTETLLGFTAVAKSVADKVAVPAGYTATVIYALGDPLTADTAPYKNDGTDTDFDKRAGDHHDGMEYFGLSASGTRDPNSSVRGLLAMNHEALTQQFLHANGATTGTRPAAESDKEIDAHGVSIVEVQKGTNGAFTTVQSSPFNRRITPLTPIELSGPARGNDLMRTKYSNAGTTTRGTINNCGTGITPWGTLLTGEENWGGYFARNAGDVAARGGEGNMANVALFRYGIDPRTQRVGTAYKSSSDAFTSRHGWETSGGDDKYARWNISQGGGAATADYRNEANTYGYIVEIDPYEKTAAIKKRTALGRFAHESASFAKPVAGEPIVCYMGDDSQGEYIYKFVSTEPWNPADAAAPNRIGVGDKYLDSGTLYVAKFDATGNGEWIALVITNSDIAGYATYDFQNQGDVLINTRLAADAVRATKMDRPEWCSVHPTTGEVYYTLTNNSNRRLAPNTSAYPAQFGLDAANPRAYTDTDGNGNSGNVNGHIVRLAEAGGKGNATSFKWDVYLFGAESDADPSLINLSNLTADQDFSSPDGLAFSKATGLCWIQTDDGAYTDVTNCMMLAAIPGKVGDGGTKTLTYNGTTSVTTQVGKPATADTLKRFLVGPKDCEITGIAETPDGKALFVNIQHPGETISKGNVNDPSKYLSHWPANAGYGAGGANGRPRSATIVITKNDGGRIGT
ncbi:PhoX family protein [Noviherbaspirillum aridicola]|uniref:Phosphatase n=1 Tax=Noviherbaspirillum aridicola TaxID=2849687 RepID=A0ABQ4PZE1_9BURK|nr:PhoX family phosphatase [Noviherbaspirillum aridicola]GIZ50122.1 phosphatase [Noviherbaspirillum aridicola]